MPATCLRGSYQTASLSSFDLSTPRDVISLWIKRSVANGIRSFWICDYQENMERFRYFAQIAKAEGAEVVTSLMYTSSPVHTDDHWVEKTRLIADAKDCTDRIMIEDASGVITPENTRRPGVARPAELRGDTSRVPLLTAIQAWLPLCYLEAIQAGVTHRPYRRGASRQRHFPAGNGDHAEEHPPPGLRVGPGRGCARRRLGSLQADRRERGAPGRKAAGVRPLSFRAPGARRDDDEPHAATPRDEDGASPGRDPGGSRSGCARITGTR